MTTKVNNWLKLKVDFFQSLPFKKLRKIAGGDTYLIIYQKLMVSVGGSYILQGIEDTIEQELALILDETEDTIVHCLIALQEVDIVHNIFDCNKLVGIKINNFSLAKGRDRNNKEYKNWRSAVFMRDNYTCQICGEFGVILNAHHIKYWIDYQTLRFDLNNDVTLCKPCHKKIHRSNKNV